MANTFTKIASVTVGSGGASTIDFNSIPATYTDLVVKMSARLNVSGEYDTIRMTINSATSTYNNILLYNADNAVGFTSVSGQAQLRWLNSVNGTTSTANSFSNWELYIPNYAGSTAKSMSVDAVTENNATTGQANTLAAGLWSGTSAITNISFAPAYSFLQYSTAVLYGIKNS